MGRTDYKKSEDSLGCFVQALQGTTVVVELQNDLVLRGHLEEVDAHMNLLLADVLCESPEGERTKMGQVWVKGTRMRYIHMSKNLDVNTTVENHRKKTREAARRYLNENTKHLNLKELQNINANIHEGDDGLSSTFPSQLLPPPLPQQPHN
mmetsp:Transcript_12598/g.21324  ORF Transcript_12598/g.21324 Transcript_12598/m.21324 type:complete len:151 (-) Transcript_12598:302-754(-)|eukprot:CAMPEP_0198197314 /NCGR_PEP_ID=MMETSP1445-20131203/923_1 /TAXON_ID=36898 /ORGANISM="Pyramimonas sp., Strain CCMP2087" /LENGTH=150 /DNA_ID=CAMNT_0043866571 /DNA_START=231 /DNA_END=683 /DNA_ORIENTATION=+